MKASDEAQRSHENASGSPQELREDTNTSPQHPTGDKQKPLFLPEVLCCSSVATEAPDQMCQDNSANQGASEPDVSPVALNKARITVHSLGLQVCCWVAVKT